MTLPSLPAQWPEYWRDLYYEREALMYDAGVADPLAKAEADIRRIAAEGELF